MSSMHNLHIPLPGELHDRLRSEAHRSGRPATAIARDAIAAYLDLLRKTARSTAIRAFADAHAGGELDHDPALQEAGLESLARRTP